jgi:hypothetical protein
MLRPWQPATLVTLFVPVAAAVTGMGPGLAQASASSGIEGVWSFNGGEIAVQKDGAGTYVGTVVAKTTFVECAHPVGQQIWTDMKPQPDGSLWGFHQWYVSDSSGCVLDSEYKGPTAWRTLTTGSGQHYLKVCFSKPGTTQPTIAPNGAVANDSYGCSTSALVASLTSGAASFKLVTGLPTTKRCLSRRSFRIHIQDPRNDAFRVVTITIGAQHLSTYRRGRFIVATVNLKGQPKGAFRLRISGRTVQGRHLRGTRTYHTCERKPRKALAESR